MVWQELGERRIYGQEEKQKQRATSETILFFVLAYDFLEKGIHLSMGGKELQAFSNSK